MAFGARELRLILSIQSYGTSNFAKVRRDITDLERATKAANLNQLANQQRMVRESERLAASQKRIRGLEKQALGAQGIGPLRTRQKIMKELNAMGYSGVVLQDMMLGKSKANSVEAQAMVNTLRAQEKAHANILHSLGIEKVLAGEIAAEYARIATEGAAQAAAADATVARQNRLMKGQTIARGVGHVGRTAQFTGLLGVAGLALAANAAAKFNKQLVLAATQARGINEPLSRVAQITKDLESGFTNKTGKRFEGILALMQKFPASADDMAKSIYDIYSSMRVTEGEGLGLLKSFNQLAVATGGDLPTATNAGITVLNDFDNAGKDVTGTLNLMVSIIRFGRLHLEQFNQMLNKVAPAAQASEQSLKDVSGAMAFLTTRMPSQPQAATGIARLLQTFRDPDFQKGVFKFGVDITKGSKAVGALKPLPVILNMMAKSFKTFGTQGGPGQLFKQLTSVGAGTGAGRQSRIEAINAYTLLIKNIKAYNTLQRLTTGDTVEFQRALDAMSAAPGVRWEVFVNQMHAFLITVGEAALPALLKFAGHISRIVHWFEGLNKGTRDLIVKFMVFGSVAAVLGGTLLSLGGSIAAMIIGFKLSRVAMAAMGTEAEATAVKVGFLGASLKVLGGLGLIAIPIILQLIRGGEPGLWTFLSGALSGAAGGAMIGSAIAPGIGTAIGAAAGAITVPLVIDLVSHLQGHPQKMTAARKEYTKQLKAWQESIWTPGVRGKGATDPGSFDEWLKANPKYAAMEATQKKHNNNTSNLLKNYKKLLKQENKDTIDQLTSQQKQLQAVYDKQVEGTKKTHQREEALARAHTNAMQAAQANMNQKIESAVKNLAQIYDTFEQMNKQALGNIAQGPTMQGILGSVFGNINDTLRQFGVQIPVPFQILRKDLDQQMTYFRRWRSDLDKLTKKAGPKGFKMVQELQAMGPEKGISIVEGLLGTNPTNVKKYVSDYNSIQDEVKAAAKTDMDKQLGDWMKHGKDIAWAIINGLSESEALLSAGFKKYVTTNFGSILQKEFSAEVALAMSNAVADLNAQDAAAAATAADAAANSPAGKKVGKGKSPIRGMSIAAATAAVRAGHQPFREPWMNQGIIQGISAPPGTRDSHMRHVSVYHGDNITIHGSSPDAAERFMRRRDFVRRHRGSRG